MNFFECFNGAFVFQPGSSPTAHSAVGQVGNLTYLLAVHVIRSRSLRPRFAGCDNGPSLGQIIDPLRQIVADLGQPGHQLVTKVSFD